MSKKLTPYEIIKNIHTALAKDFTCVKADYDRSLYHTGAKNGYYTVETTTHTEGSIIGTYSIMYYDDEGPWDVYSGFITMSTVPQELVNFMLLRIQLSEDTGWFYQ